MSRAVNNLKKRVRRLEDENRWLRSVVARHVLLDPTTVLALKVVSDDGRVGIEVPRCVLHGNPLLHGRRGALTVLAISTHSLPNV